MYYLESHGTEPTDYPRSFAVLDLVRFVWRRKGYLLLSVPLALILGAAIYHYWVPKYLSEAQLLVVKKSPHLIPGVDTRFAAMDDTLAVHSAVIRSPLLVSEAIRHGNLDLLPSLRDEKDVAEKIIKSLAVSPSSRISNQDSSALLNLAYISTNPKDSSIVLNAILVSYEDFLKSLHRADSEASAELYQQWRDEVQGELSERQEAYRQLKESDLALAMGTSGDAEVAHARLNRVDTARLDQSIRRSELENRLKTLQELQARGASPTLLIELAQQGRKDTLSQSGLGLRERLMELRLMEQTMLSKYGPRHPDLVAVRGQIELMQGQQQLQQGDETRPQPADVDIYVQLLQRELEGVNQVEASLGELVSKEQDRVERIAEKRDELENVRSEIERIQELHTEIVKQVQGVDLVKESKAYEAQLITPPEPGKKVSPSLPAFAFAFTLLGLCIGAVLALHSEMTDQSVGSVGEVRSRLNIPVLGQIPRFRLNGREPLKSALCTYYAPDSAGAEAYRRLRTAIFFRDPHERSSLLQVTSPDTGDGTSTVAANLAVSIAQSGKTVLLIDANLRTPTIGVLFNVDDRVGFADLLSGNIEADDAICASEVPRLSIITAGSNLASPAELLASARLPELLQAAGARYDYVIVDTPALMAVSDPGMVAPHVDGVLMTVNVTSAWPRVVQAKEMLDSLNVRIIGATVNGLPGDAFPSNGAPRLEQHSRS